LYNSTSKITISIRATKNIKEFAMDITLTNAIFCAIRLHLILLLLLAYVRDGMAKVRSKKRN
jgi:hypothetical protein